MLHFANVRAGGTSLVVDGVRGFLVAAVARRHAGQGVVLSGYEPPSQSEIGLELLKCVSAHFLCAGPLEAAPGIDACLSHMNLA